MSSHIRNSDHSETVMQICILTACVMSVPFCCQHLTLAIVWYCSHCWGLSILWRLSSYV